MRKVIDGETKSRIAEDNKPLPYQKVYRFIFELPGISPTDRLILGYITHLLKEGSIGVFWASDSRIAEDLAIEERTVRRSLCDLEAAGMIARDTDQTRDVWCRRLIHPGPGVSEWFATYSAAVARTVISERMDRVSRAADKSASADTMSVASGHNVRCTADTMSVANSIATCSESTSNLVVSGGSRETRKRKTRTHKVVKPVEPSSLAVGKDSGQQVESKPGQESVGSGEAHGPGALPPSGHQDKPESVGVGEVTACGEKSVLAGHGQFAGGNASADLAFAWARQVEELTGTPQLKPGGKEFAAAKRLLAVATKERILVTARRAYLAAVTGGDKTRFWVITDIADLAGKWARLAGFLASGDGLRIGGQIESGPGLKERVVANGKPSTQSRAILAPAWRDNLDGF